MRRVEATVCFRRAIYINLCGAPVEDMNPVRRIYRDLLRLHGPQGWWPLLGCAGTNPTKTGSIQGYHPGDYSHPRTRLQQFEICLGAITTQNTSWVQAEQALRNLKQHRLLSPAAILAADDAVLKACLKPAGYFNQKARKLREFARFYRSLRGRTPLREELLAVWGIGKETADSMLCYAFKVPAFVVDAYTRRIFSHLGIIGKDAAYDVIQAVFERALAPLRLDVCQEYHALIVEHAKNFYDRSTDPAECPLYRSYG
jgi:endonuclease-3 related protein